MDCPNCDRLAGRVKELEGAARSALALLTTDYDPLLDMGVAHADAVDQLTAALSAPAQQALAPPRGEEPHT